MSEQKPCPLCGKIPRIDDNGSELFIECCFSMGFQKGDELSIEQRNTWDNSIYKYSDEVEEYLRELLIARYNSRVDSGWISVEENELDKIGQDNKVLIRLSTGEIVTAILDGWNRWRLYIPTNTKLYVYYGDSDYDIIRDTVTHWMPLPPDPEGE